MYVILENIPKSKKKSWFIKMSFNSFSYKQICIKWSEAKTKYDDGDRNRMEIESVYAYFVSFLTYL